jgi:hypothetical protein
MTRKTRIRNTFAALAISALALAGLTGTAGATGKAPTKVVIHAESGGFYGTVKSPNPTCRNERLVLVFKQLGSRQRPATDHRVAMDTTEENGEWDLGNPGLHFGRYYARAIATPECRAANSITLRAQQ